MGQTHKKNKDGKLGIVKDILAMANTQDGGKLVFGVKDGDYDFVGLSQEDFDSFEQTKVNDFLQNYTEPEFACQVYHRVIDKKRVVVIDVPEFKVEPIICKNKADSTKETEKEKRKSKKQILREGQVYIRTDKATTEAIKSVEDMRDLLRRATVKKGDELLHNIQLLITGKPLKTDDDTIEKYEKEIEEAKSFFNEKIGSEYSKYGYWQVVSYPNVYLPERISDKIEVGNLIESSEVKLRGWYFPHTDRSNVSYFNKGIRSYTVFDYHIEGYRAYKSGLFVWKRYFKEDIINENHDDKRNLSFITAMWTIIEIILFFKRYYEEIAYYDDLSIEISLHGTENRFLFEGDFNVDIGNSYFAKEGLIESELKVKVIELKTSYEEIAKKFIKDIFLYFNWKISDEIVNSWLSKLLDK